MRAAWYWARSGLRSRWRATLLLVVLVGLAGGAVLTGVVVIANLTAAAPGRAAARVQPAAVLRGG